MLGTKAGEAYINAQNEASDSVLCGIVPTLTTLDKEQRVLKKTLRKKHVGRAVMLGYGMDMSNQDNITRDAAGWSVRIVRNGQQHSKYFRFSDGGVRAALARAKRWRDKKLREVGKRQWRSGPRKRAVNNTSGTAGVSKNVYGRWVATWQEEGRQRFKTFKTKKEAIAYRKEKVEPSR